MEIQIFEITLKTPDLSRDILKVIDKAIPYPIFYRLQFENRINRTTTYKRVSGAHTGNSIIGDYFETGWRRQQHLKYPSP